MEKLPVFRTAGRAIGFTLWNSFTIFRLAWLPFTALFAAQIGLSLFILRIDGETLDHLPNPLTVGTILERVLAFDIAYFVLEAIAVAAVAVSIHRVILFGERRPGQYFNFAFGKTEFLYILMGILTALIVLAVVAAFLAPFVFIATGGDPAGMFEKFAKDPESLRQTMQSGMRSGWLAVFFVFYFVMYIFIIYLSLRLAVWPPSVVATNRISPSEPWQLTRGNVWRLIGAFFVTFGWIYILILIPLATASYWYYTNKMAQPAEKSAITAPVTPAEDHPDPSKEGAPKAAEAPMPSAAPSIQAPQPPSSPPAPEVAPKIPAPAAPAIDESEDNLQNRDDQMRRFDDLVAPFGAAMWVVNILMYIYFTALAVALMSFSYKALKGYDAYEPIPGD